MTNVHCDWFEVTEPLQNAPFSEWMYQNLLAWNVTRQHSKGLNGYREKTLWGGIVSEQYSPADERMGRHWTFPGSSWDKLSKQTGFETGWTYWLRSWAELGKGNVTRIDLASDFTDVDARTIAADIIHGMNEGLCRKRSWTEMANSKDGYTMYFGSRQSDVMLRTYDKGAQMNLEPFRLARTEFEVKKAKSRSLGDGMRMHLRLNDSTAPRIADWLAQITVGLMVEFIPVHTLRSLGVEKWGVQPIALGSWLPKSMNDDAWYWNVVVPALKRRVIAANGEFDEVFWSEFMKRMGGSDAS